MSTVQAPQSQLHVIKGTVLADLTFLSGEGCGFTPREHIRLEPKSQLSKPPRWLQNWYQNFGSTSICCKTDRHAEASLLHCRLFFECVLLILLTSLVVALLRSHAFFFDCLTVQKQFHLYPEEAELNPGEFVLPKDKN